MIFLREICHKGLARLVGTYGSSPVEPWALKMLIEEAMEPDHINEQKIIEDILNIFTIPIEWLIDHTIQAKRLAVIFIRKAFNTHRKGINSWPKFLGWAFHFIADWGTPYHSPISKSNPFFKWIVSLGVIGVFINNIIKPSKNFSERLKISIDGALKGAGVGTAVGAIDLAIKHRIFEIRCDMRWKRHVFLVKDLFEAKLGYYPPFYQFDQKLKMFEEMMDKLRQKCNSLHRNWIMTSSNSEFADYLAQIAIIMDFACQIVTK